MELKIVGIDGFFMCHEQVAKMEVYYCSPDSKIYE